jgi:hypothetical protein
VKYEHLIKESQVNKMGSPLGYIKEFTENKSTEFINIFLKNESFLFAIWLNKRLWGSKILYITEEKHYVVKWFNQIFDITGNVSYNYNNSLIQYHEYEGQSHKWNNPLLKEADQYYKREWWKK